MPLPEEGYVYHTYGPDHYVRHAVASVITLRRHDTRRPVALFCPPAHRRALERHGLDTLFEYIGDLPEAHCSIVGFKHHLHRFMPFERCLFLDADMVWCRNPDRLWGQLSVYPFTASGLERADFFFGGPKSPFGILLEILRDRRSRTLRTFGLTYLPRIQAGMIYAQDRAVTQEVCQTAAEYLARRDETHFHSRLKEGRTEESCEWSLAMAMSRFRLPVHPWHQGYNSPQLDFIDSLTEYEGDFENVTCRYYSDRFIYEMRGFPNRRWRGRFIRFFGALLGRRDYLWVTPFVLHFGFLHQKQPFQDFSNRTWARLTETRTEPALIRF